MPNASKAKIKNLRVRSKEMFIGQEGTNWEEGRLSDASNPFCSLDKVKNFLQGCPNFWHLWATLEEIVLGHTLNASQHVITKISHNVLSKFTFLCWAEFIDIQDCMWPVGGRLDTPAMGLRATGMVKCWWSSFNWKTLELVHLW